MATALRAPTVRERFDATLVEPVCHARLFSGLADGYVGLVSERGKSAKLTLFAHSIRSTDAARINFGPAK